MEKTHPPPPVLIRQASSPAELAAVVECFDAYVKWLNVDISFQNYASELSQLPGKYAPPTGALLLASDPATEEVLGCIALRPLELQPIYHDNHPSRLRYCEVKRLYVNQSARGRQVGRRLIREVTKKAVEEGYDVMLLDTLSRMTAAMALYQSEGFKQVAPYYHNPLEGVVFFGKDIKTSGLQEQAA